VGEALMSLLDEKGRPGVTERVTWCHRAARSARAQDAVRAPRGTASKGSASQPAESGGGWLGDLLQGSGRKDSVLETVAKSAARTIGSSVGREIIRGVLGSLLGGSRRR
jgi:hypothetical protein